MSSSSSSIAICFEDSAPPDPKRWKIDEDTYRRLHLSPDDDEAEDSSR